MYLLLPTDVKVLYLVGLEKVLCEKYNMYVIIKAQIFAVSLQFSRAQGSKFANRMP